MALVNPCPTGFSYATYDIGAQSATPSINSNFVYETSGDAYFVAFCAPASQTSGTLTLYTFIKSVTGSPTFEMRVYNGPGTSDDKDRPESAGSNLATSPSSLGVTSADDDTWVSLTCTVSITAGQYYFLVVENTHGSPASNNASFVYRPTIEGGHTGNLHEHFFVAGYTTSGFNTDPTLSPNHGAGVVKMDGGEIFGFPFVSTSSHASNANDRGIRVSFNEDITIQAAQIAATSSVGGGIEINAATGGANLVTWTKANNFYGYENSAGICGGEPVTMVGGTEYDVVQTFTASTTSGTLYTMGEAEGSVPADVKAANPFLGSIDGTTPGSYTLDTSQVMQAALFFNDNPAIAGGGGSDSVVGYAG